MGDKHLVVAPSAEKDQVRVVQTNGTEVPIAGTSSAPNAHAKKEDKLSNWSWGKKPEDLIKQQLEDPDIAIVLLA